MANKNSAGQQLLLNAAARAQARRDKADKSSLSSQERPTERPDPRTVKETPGKPPVTPVAPITVDSSVKDAAVAPESDPLLQGKENARTFMSIISGADPTTRNKYLSAFTDFLALPLEQQASYLAGLDTQVKDITSAKNEQDQTRLKQTFEYELQKKKQQKQDLQNSFDKIVSEMDFNKNHDIAKENETAARVMQNVGNVGFVTGVAGSGIFSRRTALARENLQNNVNDKNIDYAQKLGDLTLRKSQNEGGIDTEIQRLTDLNARDVADLGQTQKQDELSLFLALAGNKFGKVGTQDAALVKANGGLPLPSGSAAADFAKGGTDEQRQAKGREEKAAALRQSQIDAINATRSQQQKDTDEYQTLFQVSQALSALGRNVELPGVQKRLSELAPSVEAILGEARSGQVSQEWSDLGIRPRSFYGSTGSGIGSLGDFQNRWTQNFNGQMGTLYRGINDKSRQNLTDFLQGNADLIKKYSSY